MKVNDPESIWHGAEIISTYSRAQAIDDGVLVDCNQAPFDELNRNAGLKLPVAMTATAFNQFVALTPKAKEVGNDIKGRYWDVVFMFRLAARQNPNVGELQFKFYCVTERRNPTLCTLKCVIGDDDQGNPCFTFMLPDED